MNTRFVTLCVLTIACSAHPLGAQSFERYRSFELGSTVAAVSAVVGTAASAPKTLHQRPAVLQELEWRLPRWGPAGTGLSTDPVERIVFSFYNDQLFRIVVDYGRERTEGMKQADIIEAISAVYGAPLSRTARAAGGATSPLEIDSGVPIARWGDTQHAVVLYHTDAYGVAFRLFVTDSPRADLARKADAEARRLDDREAPQREAAQQNQARENERAAAAKARTTNKGTFKP